MTSAELWTLLGIGVGLVTLSQLYGLWARHHWPDEYPKRDKTAP